MNFMTITILVTAAVFIGLPVIMALKEADEDKEITPKFELGARVTFNDLQEDEEDFVGNIVRAELRGRRILYTIQDGRTKEFVLAFEEHLDRADVLYSEVYGVENWSVDLPIRKEDKP